MSVEGRRRSRNRTVRDERLLAHECVPQRNFATELRVGTAPRRGLCLAVHTIGPSQVSYMTGL